MRLRSKCLMMPFAVFLIIPLVIAASWGRAEEAQNEKGTDVITVGTEPYVGPTAQELAKLAALEGGSGSGAPAAKVAEVATIGPESGNALTPAELAKLQELEQALPPLDMIKLPVMEVPRDGIPEMAPQEVRKLAELRKQGATVETPAGESDVPTSGLGQAAGHAPAGGEVPTSETAPATPEKSPRTDR